MTNVVYTAAQDTGGTICTADTGQTAPDGTTTAESCAFSPGVGGFSVVFQTITGTAANYSASVYLKRSSGTSNVYLWWELGGAMVHQSVCAVTSSWTRCTLDNKTLTATGYRLIVGMANAQGHALVAQTLSVWGLQAELGAFSSSYIPTAGTAVARGAERFTFTPGQSIASAGCLRMTATFPPVYTSGIRLMEAASSASIPLYWDTSTTVRIYDGTNGAQLSTGALVGAAKTFRSSWGGSAIGVEMVGGGSASGSFDGTMNGTVFDLGSAGGSAVHLDRYLGSTKLGATAAGCQ
jgi:hypothetical protein